MSKVALDLAGPRGETTAGGKIKAGGLVLFMSRNFYVLAGTLVLLSLVSGAMTFVPSSFQPGLPANASLWKTLALFLLLGGLISMLVGSMSNLFEQVDRRTEARRQSERKRRQKGL